MTAIGDWQLTATGEVVRVDREDLDKSGHNPRFMYTFVVRPVQLDGVPTGATVPAEVPFRIKGSELTALIPTQPQAGDRVVMSARASGAHPQTFYLTAVAGAAPDAPGPHPGPSPVR